MSAARRAPVLRAATLGARFMRTATRTATAPKAATAAHQGDPAGLGQYRRRLGEQHRPADGYQRDLSGGPFEDDRADPAADVTGALPVPYRAVHVAEDAAGQGRVRNSAR